MAGIAKFSDLSSSAQFNEFKQNGEDLLREAIEAGDVEVLSSLLRLQDNFLIIAKS